jgi:spermidine synthase
LGVPLKPLTYYYPNGPVGQVFASWVQPNMDIGLVGLGVGSLAWYGQPGQRMTYFEIDPAVVQIASEPKLFNFLSTCKADMRVVVGDARLTLGQQSGKFDLLVLDAFTSDTVPLHLLTTEAMALYKSRLKDHGLIAFHISNRYLALAPNIAAVAQGNGMVCREQLDVAVPDEVAEGKTNSQWVIIARSMTDFGPLAKDGRWETLPAEEHWQPWRDDFSNLLQALRRKMQEEGSN